MAEKAGLNPDDYPDSWASLGEAIVASFSGAADSNGELAAGAKVWFVLRGRAQEGVVTAYTAGAKTAKVKNEQGKVVEVEADRLEILDTPF